MCTDTHTHTEVTKITTRIKNGTTSILCVLFKTPYMGAHSVVRPLVSQVSTTRLRHAD